MINKPNDEAGECCRMTGRLFTRLVTRSKQPQTHAQMEKAVGWLGDLRKYVIIRSNKEVISSRSYTENQGLCFWGMRLSDFPSRMMKNSFIPLASGSSFNIHIPD